MRIYIAGPYSGGDVGENIRKATLYAAAMIQRGHTPFVPHTHTHLRHLITPMSYEEWLAEDLVWLAQCEAVLRIPGESPGADREVAEAERLGIPVYRDLESVPDVRPRVEEITSARDSERRLIQGKDATITIYDRRRRSFAVTDDDGSPD